MNKEISYRHYPLTQSLIINDYEFHEVIISNHYEEKHGSYLNDELILSLVQQLHKKTQLLPKLTNKLSNGQRWDTFAIEPLFLNQKAFRLIFYCEENESSLFVLNCFRRRKYEKKNNNYDK